MDAGKGNKEIKTPVEAYSVEASSVEASLAPSPTYTLWTRRTVFSCNHSEEGHCFARDVFVGPDKKRVVPLMAPVRIGRECQGCHERTARRLAVLDSVSESAKKTREMYDDICTRLDQIMERKDTTEDEQPQSESSLSEEDFQDFGTDCEDLESLEEWPLEPPSIESINRFLQAKGYAPAPSPSKAGKEPPTEPPKEPPTETSTKTFREGPRKPPAFLPNPKLSERIRQIRLRLEQRAKVSRSSAKPKTAVPPSLSPVPEATVSEEGSPKITTVGKSRK